jgi:hypothetical protein
MKANAAAARTARYKERQAERGKVQITVWVPADQADAFKLMASHAREQAAQKRAPSRS